MGSKRQRNVNIVNKCILRQVRGGVPFNAQFPRSYLQTNLDHTRLCISLCEIQEDNSFARGHVLLGFTKCGKYLLSYYKELQDDVSFGLFKYTLHWWKFNLRRPLQKVSHVSLFVGEHIAEDLLLIVCHTLNDNRILVHGYAYLGRDEQCRQCYVSVCSSPPETTTATCDDTWVVHMKYNLLTPFPLFIPRIQFKLKNTVILNTVDSVLAITASPCTEHDTLEPTTNPDGYKEQGDQTYCVNSLVTESKNEILKKHAEKDVILVKNATEKHNSFQTSKLPRGKSQVAQKISGASDRVGSPTKVKSPCTGSQEKSENELGSSSTEHCNHCTSNSSNHTNLTSINQEIDSNPENIECNDGNKFVKDEEYPKISKRSHLSSFSFKTFSNRTDPKILENISTSTVIDGTSYLDIQVNTASGTPYKLLENIQDNKEVKDHTSPCIHTRVISLDIERYINEALNTSDELKGKYWALRNYSTLLVDVCEGSQCVIVNIAIILSVQEDTEKATRREISSFSLLLSWSVSTGEVNTLDISPIAKTSSKSEKQIFKEGCKIVADLHRRYSVPFPGLFAVQALSNHNVFTGKTLEVIKHPFQPIAIVL
ncbi:uncharacterized protein LOC114526458 [Dendronephthya gigantea]|uniref:uncharacterized protein LOC114526458 n=1 Tax=Dendronephthya gigantea TaxID=151771 RepID=UPI0010693FD3|nr:uncharacterized protein LOC114526458 [Dendronephthya gigantea]